MRIATFGEVHVWQELDGQLTAYLPHQCDEWQLGDSTSAEELAQDILAAVDYMRQIASVNNKETS